MKGVWALLALVVIAGALALLWPNGSPAEAVVERPSAAPLPAQEYLATRAEPAAPAATSEHADATHQPNSQARIDRQPDGTLLVDGRFTLTGSGSEQDPFVIGWPLLFSASETIDAATGAMTAPGHIDFLNGQWVQISGFLAPPLWGVQTSELLVMKNRWDGCCIGLPPTAFDCIEAQLAEPMKLGAQHSISFGVMRGRLLVQPFSAGGFLIGLYRLEAARIDGMK
ncbi:MAG: hypothetical protein ACKPEA_04455, partial [Planctomycetota bacterium]